MDRGKDLLLITGDVLMFVSYETIQKWLYYNIGIREWEVQTTGCKINSRMYCMT